MAFRQDILDMRDIFSYSFFTNCTLILFSTAAPAPLQSEEVISSDEAPFGEDQ